jgi:hypothetical protein
MLIRASLFGAALAALGATCASADVRIQQDPGGQIGHYMNRFAALRSSGERIVIDGPCLSACTLLTGMIPRNRVCVTPRARLGFHAAWHPGPGGRPIFSPMGTQVLWDVYPAQVRRWISRNGGLSRRMIFLRGRELTTMYPRCR